jgi:hypothetical protein
VNDLIATSIAYTMGDHNRPELEAWEEFFGVKTPRDSRGAIERWEDEPEGWNDIVLEAYSDGSDDGYSAKKERGIPLHEFLRCHVQAFYDIDIGLGMKAQTLVEAWLKHEGLEPLHHS